ncbi:MAG: flagellar export protein FliJ [Janthinobacterium lividum]
MTHFKFRLQAVLEQRKRRETLAQQTFAESQTALFQAERLLSEMREVRQALLDELCRRRAGAFDAFETQLYQDYMLIIAQSLAEQEMDVRTLTSTCEAHKLHMVSTSQDKEALVKVHDRHKLAHKMSAQRAEQSVMDELATTRFNFQQRSHEG